jgi:energy-coupling factor transporter transmembrane protein EcfT
VPILLGWSVMIGAGVLSMGWHRPSDVMGGALLVSAVFLIVGSLFSRGRAGIRPSRLWSMHAAIVFSSVLVVVAVASAWKPMLWTVPIFAIVSLLSTALVGWTAFQLYGATGMRDGVEAERSEAVDGQNAFVSVPLEHADVSDTEVR